MPKAAAVQELKNGRVAMLATMGLPTESVYTSYLKRFRYS